MIQKMNTADAAAILRNKANFFGSIFFEESMNSLPFCWRRTEKWQRSLQTDFPGLSRCRHCLRKWRATLDTKQTTEAQTTTLLVKLYKKRGMGVLFSLGQPFETSRIQTKRVYQK